MFDWENKLKELSGYDIGFEIKQGYYHISIVFDEDCPELTEAQLIEIAAMAAKQRAERRKPLLTVRVAPDTLRKAKALGKGYTSNMGRQLDMAINNPDMLKQCL